MTSIRIQLDICFVVLSGGVSSVIFLFNELLDDGCGGDGGETFGESIFFVVPSRVFVVDWSSPSSFLCFRLDEEKS